MLVFLVGAGLFFGAYLLSAVVMKYLSSQDIMGQEYSFKDDPFLYLWTMMSAVFAAVYAFMPQMHDTLIALKLSYLIVPVLCSAVIYVAYLLEIRWLFYLAVLLSSCAAVLVYPYDWFLLGSHLPYFWLDKLLAVLIVFLLCALVPFLNGLRGHFSVFAVSVLTGVFVLSLCGGVPLFLGILSVIWAGLWTGFFQFNIFSYKIELNDGAATAAMFMISCLLLYCSAEYASASVLILLIYYVAEICWSIVHHFMKASSTDELSENSAYYIAFENYGDNLFAAAVSIIKINLINIVISAFQLFSPNFFALPLLTFIINLWMFGKIGRPEEASLTLKEANETFVREIKNNVNEIREIVQRKTNPEEIQKKPAKLRKKNPVKKISDRKSGHKRKKADVS